MKLSRKDEPWAAGASSVAGLILVFDLLLIGAGVTCLALGWSAPLGYALLAIGALIFLSAS